MIGYWWIGNSEYAAYAAVLLAAGALAIPWAVGRKGFDTAAAGAAACLSAALSVCAYAYPFASGWDAEISEPLLFAGWLFPITAALALRLFFRLADDAPGLADEPTAGKASTPAPEESSP